jgi:hypothetical protein
MRRPELAFAPREVAPGTYKFQAVYGHPSRTGTPMTKTLFPHAHLLSEPKVSDLGYDTAALIAQHRTLRATIEGGEAQRRRAQLPQVTLTEIAKRQEERQREAIAEAEEMIEAAYRFGTYAGEEMEGRYAGVYPNVVGSSEYADFDRDPDRYERMFLRTDEYRLEKHRERPERRAARKAQRQEHRRERNRTARRGWWTYGSEEGRGTFDQWAIQQPMIREDAEREYRAMREDHPEYFQ